MGESSDRFREPDEPPEWKDPVLVVCPRCDGLAIVREQGVGRARLTCGACGATLDWARDGLHVLVEGEPVRLEWSQAAGAWVDPKSGRAQHRFVEPEGRETRFGRPLWLQASCCGGHLLWANNEAHLEYLEAYISASLRERPAPPSGLAWRLPSWMKERKHRDEIIRHLARMRARLTVV